MPTVVLDAATRELRLGPRIEILEDTSGELTLEQITSSAVDPRFVKSDTDEPTYGFTSSTYWVRFAVVNRKQTADTWLLEMSYPLLDYIDLYVERTDGTFAHQTGGDHHPFHHRVIRHRNVIFPVHLEPGQRARIYLRVSTTSSVQLPPVLWSRVAFQHKDHVEQLVLGLYYGIVLVMLLYNLFLFLFIRERNYLLFVVYLASYGMTQAILNGLAFEVFWPDAIWWANNCLPLSIAVTIFTILVFTRSFLQTRQDLPRLDRGLAVLQHATLAYIPVSLFLPYPAGIRISVGATIGVSVLIVGSAIYALYKGFRAARFFALAWLAFFSGVTAHALLAYGAVPRNFFTENFHQVGSAVLVVLLSFALGDRINLIKKEKEDATARALESERRSVELERQSKEDLQREVDRQTEALRAANTQLQELDRQKTIFFQNISHELRSPLTVLINPLERLLAADIKGPPELDIKARLRAMERNTHRLLRLVNQLLDFSRLESGHSTIAYELRDLRSFIEPIIDGFRSFALAKELRLDLRAADDLPAVYFDPQKLDTVLCNLISNACKFTEPGGAVLVKVEAEARHAQITVKDTGIGIPQDQLPRVFERFHQVDDSSGRRYQGTGIGLALARELAQAMGASITLESDEGFGSTFTVQLPLGKDHISDHTLIRKRGGDEEERERLDARASHAATALAAEVGLGAADEQPDGPDDGDRDRPLVLVVEDSPDMRALVTEICRGEFRVKDVESGESALDWLAKQPDEGLPALVISDVMMPGMDGHELLERMRGDARLSAVPVMLLTAKAGPERRIESLESGADEYLTKPFDSRELSARARNLVRLKQQERQLRALNRQMEKLNLELESQVRRKSAEVLRARDLGRYLPPPVVRALMERGEETPGLSHERRRLTLFRLELRGFEDLVELLEPEDLAERLNGYLSEMLALSFRHGATVDHFVLDRVSGFFGAPNSKGVEEDALGCAKMAVEMWRRAAAICRQWESATHRPAPVPTVVLHSGPATVGSFGSSDHLDYTAVGAAVQEANMLLRAIGSGVVCSQTTWALLGGRLTGEECGAVALRYREDPLPVHRLAGTAMIVTPTPQRLSARPEDLGRAGEGPAEPSPDSGAAMLEPGAVVARRYRIVGALGTGGMGSVYRARDEKLEQEVALKLLRHRLGEDHTRISRLRDEVLLSRRVTHRNVARIYDIGEWSGGDFISMELVDGETLHHRVQQEGPLALDQALEILLQICAGLGAAHDAQVVHRDLKPSNVMLEHESGRVVLLDFGIAAAAQADLSDTGSATFVGSPHWMAPEQVTGAGVDHRADLYSLGAVAYEMLTGQTVFQAESVMAVALKHLATDPRDPREVRPDLPPALAETLLRCLAKQPAHRFDSVSEVVARLKDVQAG